MVGDWAGEAETRSWMTGLGRARVPSGSAPSARAIRSLERESVAVPELHLDNMESLVQKNIF